jgi:hypothetical protein
LFQLPRLIAGDEQDGGAPRVEDEQDADLARPRDPGRSSFRFAIFELVMVSASGAAQRGSRAAQRVEGVINQVGGLRVAVLEFPQPGGDLVGLVNVLLIHPSTIANPIVQYPARAPTCG